MKKTMVRSNRLMTLVMMMTIAISAAAMPYTTARNEALFLSDKMAYELGLTSTQYDAVYEINLDYLLNVDTRADVFGFWWEVRNRDLRLVLSTRQYDRFMASEWFYRPLSWGAGGWTFSIYTRYGVGRMFFDRPAVFVTFRGGHSHRGGSFYAGHHFDKPNPPRDHGHGNHNGNRPATGNGGHNVSAGTGFGSSHRSASANTPNRSFGSRPSGNTAGNGSRDSNAPHGTFGRRR